MTFDLEAAAGFMAAHARPLDRRRFDLLRGCGDRAAVRAALGSYRNPDGGYGWGLEPDLRSRTSQPAAALHAFEVLAELGPEPVPESAALCDWLAGAALPDGGVPFALPVPDPAACAPFWTGADPRASSLQITAAVTAMAQRVARHDPAVAAHPWLARATRYCLDAVRALEKEPHALVLSFSLRFLDAVHDREPEAAGLIAELGAFLPPDGRVHVEGGLEDEMMRPLDFAPDPGTPVRALFDPRVVRDELERLAAGQREDGGWSVDFAAHSPAASLEWRGYATVNAVRILSRAG
ncbi:hypothetical protein [Spirillospora albida]|uniref:hypothetical protein n=1 Tax=Spirillospora albida TaxID=58123 RepID=UPI0004C0262C|nr:hypothetical protein [Spirillospora albida]